MKNNSKDTKRHLSLKELLENNKFVFVFSLIIAIGLWFWVNIEKSPVVKTVITSVPVQIETENSIPSQLGLQIFGNKEYTVDVTVTGKKFIVSTIKDEDIRVIAQTNYVDSAGNKTLTLRATNNSGKDFEISSLSSNTISVYFDTLKESDFAIDPYVESTLDKKVIDDCIMGAPILSRSTVTVSGPTTEVNKITGVTAKYVLNEVLSATKTVTPELILEGASLSELSNTTVELADTTITMTIPLLKEVVLPTAVSFKNAPADYLNGSDNFSYTVSPSSIKVGVPVEKLEDTKEIIVGTIDFSDLDIGRYSTTFGPITNKEYSVSDGAKSFRVSVNMSNVTSSVVTVPASNIAITKQHDGYSSKVNSQQINSVTIIGPASALDTLTGDNVFAEIDLTNVDINEGVTTVPVKITVNGYTSCWAHGEYSVNISSVAS